MGGYWNIVIEIKRNGSVENLPQEMGLTISVTTIKSSASLAESKNQLVKVMKRKIRVCSEVLSCMPINYGCYEASS